MPTAAQLKAFFALGTAGTFKAAAERLGLTQPAVSIQIRNLENESARTLVRRGGQRIELTEDGRTLLDLVERRSRIETEIAAFLAPPGAGQRQVVTLGADGPHVALDLVAACQRAHPEIEFDVRMTNWEGAWKDLLELKVDLAVMADPPEDARVHRERISSQSLQAWVPAGNPLADRAEVTLEELCAHPLVFRERGSNTQRIVSDALALRGLSPRVAMQIGSREGVREAVVRGIGIGFGFNRENDSLPGYSWVPITGHEHSNTDMLLCLQAQRTSAAFGMMSQAIRDIAD